MGCYSFRLIKMGVSVFGFVTAYPSDVLLLSRSIRGACGMARLSRRAAIEMSGTPQRVHRGSFGRVLCIRCRPAVFPLLSSALPGIARLLGNRRRVERWVPVAWRSRNTAARGESRILGERRAEYSLVFRALRSLRS